MAEERDTRLEATIDRAIQDFVRKERHVMNDHPSVDELVDYQEERLAGETAQRVRRHLARCRECSEDMLELEDWDPEAPVDSALLPTAEKTTETWRALRRRLEEEAQALSVARVPVPMPAAVPSSSRSPLLRFLPLAASILIAVTGIASWLAGGLTGDGVVGPNPFVFDLVPDGADRIRAAALQEVEVPARLDPLVPRLNLGDQTPYGGYRAEIVDDSGAVVWWQGDLLRQPAGHFNALIPREQLPPGSYRLRLTGNRGDEEAELATFSFRIHYLPVK